MQPVGPRVKRFLNAQANVRLAQLGYTDPMIRDAKREAWWWLQNRASAARKGVGLIGGQAVVWTDSGRSELLPVEVPLAGAGEVTVEVLAGVVSAGTERAQYLRLPNARVGYPHRPGYASAGRVLAAGEGVTGLREGDAVAVRGAPHASVVTVPAEMVHRVPDPVALEAAAFTQLGVICGQGADKAEIAPGAPFAIVGAGIIGLLTQRIATAAGAGPATFIAASRRKEDVARAGGAAAFVTADETDAVAAIDAPSVIEATGDPDGIEVAVAAVRDAGRIVLLGSSRGTTARFPIAAIREKEAALVGAHVETLASERRRHGGDPFRDVAERFLAQLAEGALEVADLAPLRVDPREMDVFYRDLSRRRDLVAATIDWLRLPRMQRVRAARAVRAPDVRARGLDRDRKLLPVRVVTGRADDPLARPTGDLRVALVGCGDIAVHNAAGIGAAPNARVVACFDPVRGLAEELAAAHGADVAPAFEAVLERRDVDAVFLAVPHHLHAPMAIEAAEAGKHVIVEKPMANNLAAAVAMADAARRAGVVLSICFPHRYDGRVEAARRLVERGALGEFQGTLTTFYAEKPASYWLGGFSGRAVSRWRSSREHAGGGLLIMNLSHLVDLARFVSGEEVGTLSGVADVEPGGAAVEDTVSVSISYAGGGVGALFGSAGMRGHRGRPAGMDLWGADGYLTVEPDGRLYTTRALDGVRTGRWQRLGGAPGAIRRDYISRLATAVALGRAPEVGPDDGLAVQAFIEAAYRSNDGQGRVSPAALLAEARRPARRAA